jgi:2,5-furandicarboxylate decarboxylase 1
VIGNKYEERGEDFPLAVAIGMHPAIYLAAATSLEYGDDELTLAGGLLGEPVRMTPGVTIPIDVPADAEVVIEGWIRKGDRVSDGPFGELLRTYTMSPQVSNRFEITAITHRKDAIYQTMAAGSSEDVNLLGLSRSAAVEDALRRAGFDVVSFDLTPTIMSGVLSIRQSYVGEAKGAAMLAPGSYRWLKYCIVVDDDVDTANHETVMWAITTRLNPTTGIQAITGTVNFPGDPFGAYSAKLVIDATYPVGERPEFERSVPPGHDTVVLEDFL